METAPTADTEKPAAKAEPANENTDEAGTDAAAKTEEVTTGETTEGEKPAEEQKEEKKYFFRINLDGAGIVKVILSSDEGAGKDDPSAAISKDAEGKAEKKTRNDYVDKAIVNEDGTDLAFELTEGEKIEVITETPEGFKVSEYRITTDSGAEIEADPSSWEYTLTEDTALKVVVEKEPEFTAEQTVGKYIVKVHAAAGILPAGTVAEIRELSDEEAKPLVKETEKTVGGEVVAAIDITFKDAEGKEVQPAGMVEVTFDNAVEDGLEMSVVHAVDGKTDKLETVPSDTEGDSVKFQSDSFSPFLLTASEDEPDWTKGGGGRKDVSDQISVMHNGSSRIKYEDYDFWSGNGARVTYSTEMYVGDKLVGTSLCVSPRLWGPEMDGVVAKEVYEVSAPMFVKALYYGPYGPGSDVISDVTGYTDEDALNIIAHVAASEIYARLGYGNAAVNEGLNAASGKLKNAVYKYVNYIANLDPPSGYYGYVTEGNGYTSEGGLHQNFAFGSFGLTKGSAQVKKVSSAPEMTNGNSCYSLEGATYWIYTSEAAAKARGDAGRVSDVTLITDAKGDSNTIQLDPGTYYMIEVEAPRGFKRSDDVIPFTITSYNTTVVPATDAAADEPAIYIDKKCKKAEDAEEEVPINSLEGTEFTVNYYNEYYDDASSLPSKATKTWVIKVLKTKEGLFRALLDDEHFVSGDSFYRDGNNNIILPLGTITIEETKAAKGYVNDGKFGGADMYIGQVRLNSDETDTELVDIQGKRTTSNSFEVTDTPEEPEIKTTALDQSSESHTAFAGGEITVVDTVSYKNLIVNNEYTLKGRLMDKKTGEPVKDTEGREVTAETKFTAKTIDGSVNMPFTFKTDSSFAGKSIVAFENVEFEGKEVAVHADINDENQTIHFPKIGTTAVNPDTKDHILKAGENAVVRDTVYYENLVPGNEYSVRGILMLKPDNKPLLINGKEVTAEKTFTPESADGQVDVVFTFDATGLENKDLVVYEAVYVGNSLIGEHKDLNDKEQTVHFPGVETDAYDKDTEKKNTLAAEDRVIVDQITYKNLLPGKTYEISGEVKIKAADAADFDSSETVPSQIVDVKGEGEISFDSEKVTFIPAGNDDETVSGVLFVSFKVDATYLAGEEIVVGETVRYRGVEIAVHRDLEDTRQNDFIPKGKTVSVDTETGIKNTLAAENRVFKDTFSYEKLIPGETYRFTGKVMAENGTDEEGNTVLEEIPSVMTDEKGVPVENGCIEFIPEEQDGELELYFSIDATTLENRDVTVFEKVTLNGEPVIIHEVLDGTQTVYVPEGRTQVVDSETKDQIAMPDEEVTVIDTLVYKNLIPGTTYTVKGRVMRKNDASEVPSVLKEASFKEVHEGEGQEGSSGTISVADNVVTFTPDQEDGFLELTFAFNGSELKGEDTVIFERVYHNGAEVIVHENIDDEPQTVHLPDGSTEAADPDTDDRTMMAGGDVTIRDRFYYENLIPGDEYVIHGKVMLKPEDGKEAQELEARMVDADGNEVEEWVFTPSEKNGSEDIYFVINSDGLAGRSVVMFETLEFINPELETRTVIVIHEDIDDEEQTVHFPDGRTTALDSDTRSHTANADEEVTIFDEVKFINLIPGKMYTVTGTLMDKETGREVVADGRVLTSTKEFVPDTSDGSVIIEFTFNGADLAGRSVVAFEKVLSNGKEVFVHADLEDEDQKVDFPEIRTSAVDKKDGDREISYKGTVRIADTVTYKNLMPGTRYHVTGVLMNKSSGQPATSGGKEITGETVFTAAQKDGSVEVILSFNSSDLDDGEYVVFETVYEISAEIGDENVVGRHADINDQAQTVKRRTPPGTPKTGDDSSTLLWLAVLGVSAAGIAAALFFRKRRSDR